MHFRLFTRYCLFLVGTFISTGPLALEGQTPVAPASAERRVVVVVWDGLRPDSINDATTPTLARLASEGVFFTKHHPVYPSSTEVNGTAMATGCYPGHSGLIGNREYRPEIDPLKDLATEGVESIRVGDRVSSGKYLRVPTMPELLQAAGVRTLIAGTKPVAVLWDRAARPDPAPGQDPAAGSVVLFSGQTIPSGVAARLSGQGSRPFPMEVHLPNIDEDAWTTHALTDTLWSADANRPAKLSVLWMSDPDYTQHQFGPDSPQARRALGSVDSDLSAVLYRLGWKPDGDTDVFVISDHGFSTIGRQIDLAKLLVAAGFPAERDAYKEPPAPGQILVCGLGGSVYLYVAGHDAAMIRRLVDFLEGSDYAGVIFTKEALPGTFALSSAHIDSLDAPDVAVALRWSAEPNAGGFPGLVASDGGRHPGQGTHASLSRFDLHNTLVAAGPDFRGGWRDELPTGNVDLAPTIAHILRLPDPPPMDGRVLAEALKDGASSSLPGPPRTERLTVTQPIASGAWTQYLQVTRYGGVDYLDEGNGGGGSAVSSAP